MADPNVLAAIREFRYVTNTSKPVAWGTVRSVDTARARTESIDLGAIKTLTSALVDCDVTAGVAAASQGEAQQLCRALQLLLQFHLHSQKTLLAHQHTIVALKAAAKVSYLQPTGADSADRDVQVARAQEQLRVAQMEKASADAALDRERTANANLQAQVAQLQQQLAAAAATAAPAPPPAVDAPTVPKPKEALVTEWVASQPSIALIDPKLRAAQPQHASQQNIGATPAPTPSGTLPPAPAAPIPAAAAKQATKEDATDSRRHRRSCRHHRYHDRAAPAAPHLDPTTTALLMCAMQGRLPPQFQTPGAPAAAPAAAPEAPARAAPATDAASAGAAQSDGVQRAVEALTQRLDAMQAQYDRLAAGTDAVKTMADRMTLAETKGNAQRDELLRRVDDVQATLGRDLASLSVALQDVKSDMAAQLTTLRQHASTTAATTGELVATLQKRVEEQQSAVESRLHEVESSQRRLQHQAAQQQQQAKTAAEPPAPLTSMLSTNIAPVVTSQPSSTARSSSVNSHAGPAVDARASATATPVYDGNGPVLPVASELPPPAPASRPGSAQSVTDLVKAPDADEEDLCPHCAQPVTDGDVQTHAKQCDYRPEMCSWCGATYSAKVRDVHISQCPDRPKIAEPVPVAAEPKAASTAGSRNGTPVQPSAGATSSALPSPTMGKRTESDLERMRRELQELMAEEEAAELAKQRSATQAA